MDGLFTTLSILNKIVIYCTKHLKNLIYTEIETKYIVIYNTKHLKKSDIYCTLKYRFEGEIYFHVKKVPAGVYSSSSNTEN